MSKRINKTYLRPIGCQILADSESMPSTSNQPDNLADIPVTSPSHRENLKRWKHDRPIENDRAGGDIQKPID